MATVVAFRAPGSFSIQFCSGTDFGLNQTPFFHFFVDTLHPGSSGFSSFDIQNVVNSLFSANNVIKGAKIILGNCSTKKMRWLKNMNNDNYPQNLCAVLKFAAA